MTEGLVYELNRDRAGLIWVILGRIWPGLGHAGMDWSQLLQPWFASSWRWPEWVLTGKREREKGKRKKRK